MQESERQGREADVSSATLADLRAALRLDFDDGRHRPILELCAELVADLDQVPVKHLPTTPDLPALEESVPQSRMPAPRSRKLGRNDPCWCGSGEKYKRCHWRKDRAARM